jgi:hypothetical protein
MSSETTRITAISGATAPRAQEVNCRAQASATKRVVGADDELVLSMHLRVSTQYVRDAYGTTELRLSFRGKEISFDEPQLFGFGETLAGQSRFIARNAMQWGKGLSWLRVQGLLEQLIEEGLLQFAEHDGNESSNAARTQPPPA